MRGISFLGWAGSRKRTSTSADSQWARKACTASLEAGSRAARGFLRGRDGQQGRALVDQQRVAQFPGGQLQRLGHVQRAVLGIGRDVADAVAQRDLGVGEPGFLGASTMAATPSAACPRCAQASSAALADVAGRGPGRAPAPSARRPASPGPAPLPAWRGRGRSPARRRRRWTDHGLRVPGHVLDMGATSTSSENPMVLIARAAEPTLPGWLGFTMMKRTRENAAGERFRGRGRPLRKRAIYRPGTVRR